MSIEKIFPEDIDVVTVETNIKRFFASSSSGLSGSVYIFPRRSIREKEVYPLAMYSSSWVSDVDIKDHLKLAKSASLANRSNTGYISSYLTSVNSQSISAKKQQTVNVIRFTPGFGMTEDMFRKATVIETLYPYYRPQYSSMHFSFTNYNCLNFFTASNVPSDSALLYPLQNVVLNGDVVSSGSYVVTGAFSFDFWINPRYTTVTDGLSFKAGTILHLSSCYAVSLITGSSLDQNGKPNKFRVLLQLSSSAERSPSSINVNSLPEFTFLSADNALERNKWHHVTIRWGGGNYNYGSGSIVVDKQRSTYFSIPSASLQNRRLAGSDGPNVLVVGNYYEGSNTGASSMARFFTTDVATREGLLELVSVSGLELPTTFDFSHPLNAEVHELKIYNKFLSDNEISSLQTNAPKTLDNLLFYVPPFFTEESPTRTLLAGKGGVFKTPFQTFNGTTKKPFSGEMAFEVGGHYINLENFTRDFATNVYPRNFALSAALQTAPLTVPATANQILYASSSVRKRNLTILPCDNGVFNPNFRLLSNLSSSQFKNDLGTIDLSLVTLKEIIPTASIFRSLLSERTGSITDALSGPNPSNSSTFTYSASHVPGLLQRTRDNNSNQIVFFDVSNLFYGNYIKPKSLRIYDSSLSASGDKVSITLRDDGNGNIFRADSTGSNATWNSVGNIFYNEGIVLIKHPSLFFLGENQFTIEFSGSHNLHVMSIDCTARGLHETSSSNPTYLLESSASNLANVTDSKYVWISDVLIHDDNLNVITRTTMAQPLMKKISDKFTYKIKIDF